MTDKEYIKKLFEEINICDKIISKYEKLTNGYKHEIERLNNEYNKAFERLKSQQREIDRLKEENERFENNMKSVLEIEKKQAVKDVAKKYHDAVKKMFDDADCCGWIEDGETKYWHEDNDKIAREQFGVEIKE